MTTTIVNPDIPCPITGKPSIYEQDDDGQIYLVHPEFGRLDYPCSPCTVPYPETVIDGPGWYITRCGLPVRIEEVEEPGPVRPLRLTCKGYLYRKKRGKWKADTWMAWHFSGGCGHGSGPNKLDVVERSQPPQL